MHSPGFTYVIGLDLRAQRTWNRTQLWGWGSLEVVYEVRAFIYLESQMLKSAQCQSNIYGVNRVMLHFASRPARTCPAAPGFGMCRNLLWSCNYCDFLSYLGWKLLYNKKFLSPLPSVKIWKWVSIILQVSCLLHTPKRASAKETSFFSSFLWGKLKLSIFLTPKKGPHKSQSLS